MKLVDKCTSCMDYIFLIYRCLLKMMVLWDILLDYNSLDGTASL